MTKVTKEVFDAAAKKVTDERLVELKMLTYEDAFGLPGALSKDIVVAGKEVQMTIFRQLGLPDIPEAVLVTVQISRAGLGGLVSYHYERALVYTVNGEFREATQSELLATGG